MLVIALSLWASTYAAAEEASPCTPVVVPVPVPMKEPEKAPLPVPVSVPVVVPGDGPPVPVPVPVRWVPIESLPVPVPLPVPVASAEEESESMSSSSMSSEESSMMSSSSGDFASSGAPMSSAPMSSSSAPVCPGISTTLTAVTLIAATELPVASSSGFTIGDLVLVGDTAPTEPAIIKAVEPTKLTLESNLAAGYISGAKVTALATAPLVQVASAEDALAEATELTLAGWPVTGFATGDEVIITSETGWQSLEIDVADETAFALTVTTKLAEKYPKGSMIIKTGLLQTTLSGAATVGTSALGVASVTGYATGDQIMIDADEMATIKTAVAATPGPAGADRKSVV